MTFLELCQMVSRESGTASGSLPSSVVGQTGRLLKIVSWTASAWTQIQNHRNAWLWMRGEFSGTTTAPTAKYMPASWGLTRHAAWITDDDSATIYLQSAGVADEGPLIHILWKDYRQRFGRGTQVAGKPTHYAISPAGEFCLGPIPDDVYVVNGEYRKSPQSLTANSDVPEMPARFHELVAWYGLLLLAEHDEGQIHIAMALRRYRDLIGELERDQLGTILINQEPLA